MPGENGPQPVADSRSAPPIPDVLQESPGPAAAHPRVEPVSASLSLLRATLFPSGFERPASSEGGAGGEVWLRGSPRSEACLSLH